MQTSIYGMDKQQGPTEQHRDIQYSLINQKGKEYEKEYIWLSHFCCRAEINTVNQLHFNKILKQDISTFCEISIKCVKLCYKLIIGWYINI